MKVFLPLLVLFLLLSSCAKHPAPAPVQSTSTGNTTTVNPLSVARQTISKREQWAYDGDYKATDYVVNGKKAGWKVRVLRINNPNVPKDDPSRYDPAGPVILIINESGWVTSYKSPYRQR